MSNPTPESTAPEHATPDQAAPERATPDHAASERSTLSRVGFWLGLALFALLLIVPPPQSMRDTVRAQFADTLPAEAQAILAARGQADFTQGQSDATHNQSAAAPDSPEYAAAMDAAVDARARVMLAAAAVTALVACWWITVAIPIAATSLLPLALFPLVGVVPVAAAAQPYAHPTVFLFMGGMIIALGIERWNLHRRIALLILTRVGVNRSTIVLGFMIASAVLSMWISNTATALMMLPIALAMVATLDGLLAKQGDPRSANFAAALMLGLAYASSIGGTATPIGTPPNIAFLGQFQKLFPDAPEIGFAQWLLVFLPLAIVFIPIAWLVLVKWTCRFPNAPLPEARAVIRRELSELGPLRGPERTMLFVFAAAAVLWITRSIPIGDANAGWAAGIEWLLQPADGSMPRFRAGYINDTTVALVIALLMFMIPAGRDEHHRRRRLMNWETANRLPWGVLLLFGGGFAIAAGFRDSGLSHWCGAVFGGLGIQSPLLLIICTCLLMTFLTEITSNTATTQVMLPIMAQVSRAMGLNPLLLMLPATISASCAFMLPVATPPNAIVFGSGNLSMGHMVRSGIVLNLIGVLLVTALVYWLAHPAFGVDLDTLPDWAE